MHPWWDEGDDKAPSRGQLLHLLAAVDVEEDSIHLAWVPLGHLLGIFEDVARDSHMSVAEADKVVDKRWCHHT